MSDKIKLLVLDIDGVINRGHEKSYNIEILKKLQDINNKSKIDNSVPGISLITGRPGAYAEAICQVIGCYQPIIFEHGTGSFNPNKFKSIANPALGDVDHLLKIYEKIRLSFLKNKKAYVQTGREYSMSIFPYQEFNLEDINSVCSDILGSDLEFFDILGAQTCLNIIPKDFHKGTGLKFLSRLTGINISEMLTVGDSEIDVPMLNISGFSACPANSSDSVKNVSKYCASKKYDQGLLEILEHFEIV